MGDIVLTIEHVEADLKQLIKTANAELSKITCNTYAINRLDEALSSGNYNYTKDNNCNFRIAAGQAAYIIGEWDNGRWILNIQLTYGDIKIEKSSNKYIYPATIHKNLKLFDTLISALKRKIEEYDAKAKAKKGSELLQSLVKQTLRKLHIPETKLEPSDMGKGLLRLQKRIAPKIFLTTTLDFDNYEERCMELKKCLDQAAIVIKNAVPKSIEFIKESHSKAIHVKPSQWSLHDAIRMRYSMAPEVKIGKYNPDICDPEIVEFLSQLGYVFVIKSNEFHIRLNRWLSIYRSGNQTWIVDTQSKNIMPLTDKQEISKENFITLMRYIAVASMTLGEYKQAPIIHYDGKLEPFVSYLKPVLKTCLPDGCFIIEEYYVWIKVFFSKDDNRGVKWSRNRSTWLEDMFYVIKNFYILKFHEDTDLSSCLSTNIRLLTK